MFPGVFILGFVLSCACIRDVGELLYVAYMLRTHNTYLVLRLYTNQPLKPHPSTVSKKLALKPYPSTVSKRNWLVVLQWENQ